jgi:zinc protease
MKRLAFVLAISGALTACGGTTAPAPAPVPGPAPTPSPPPAAISLDESFRKQAPAPDPEVAFVPPKIEEARLANGIRVLLVQRHELPIVAFDVALDRGADQGEPGLGGFVGAMLLQGTKTRNALELSDALDALGANYSAFADYDGTTLRAQCLSSKLGELLPILADVVQNPAFSPAEIERERKKRLTTLAQQKDVPSILLTNAVGAALYPSDHAYAWPLLGDDAAVKKVTRQKLAAFHSAQLKPEGLTISVTGDVVNERALSELERAFGGLKGKAAVRKVPVDPGSKPPDSRIVVIDRPGAAQSNVSVAMVGVARSTPDFDALTVLNTLFGGKFSSRLNLNLREKHAYTYGAGSGFAMRHAAGPFTAGGAIVTAATGPAIREILSEIERLRNEAVAEGELADAKANLIRQLPARFETASETAASLSYLAIHGLPLDEYATRPERFAKVTREQVQAAARRYLVPERMRIVVVGDAAAIKDDLGKLGLGEPAVKKP